MFQPSWRRLVSYGFITDLLSGRHARRNHRPGKLASESCHVAVEQLEVRALLSSANPAATFNPLWFQSGSPGNSGYGHSQAATNAANEAAKRTIPADHQSWIVQLDPAQVRDLTSIDQTAELLAGLPGDFQIDRGLGKTGQVLVQTWGGQGQAVSAWLQKNPSILRVESDSLVQVNALPNDPLLTSLWGLENPGTTGKLDADIDAAAAWDISTGSRSNVVAVVDTGIDYNHTDLAANIWTNPGEIAGDGLDNDGNGFIDDVRGWDFFNNDNNPMDDNNHGTHVSGTIGAVGNNNLGVVGVNWQVSLMALKVFDSSGSGPLSGVIAATNYAAMMRDRGINVVATNNSYNNGVYSQAFFDAIAACRDEGVMVVASTSNSGTNNDVTNVFPANYQLDNIIAVTATDPNDTMLFWAPYGAVNVDLAAPGVSTYSTIAGNSYGSKSGTSMAAPHVTGVVALAASYAPDASYQQIRTAILSSVDVLPNLVGKVATGGRLNAAGTLQYLQAHSPAVPGEYLAIATPFESLDLVVGGSGVTTVLDGADDGSASIDLGSLSFTMFGTTYTGAASLFVSSNGLMTFGSGNSTAANTNLTSSPTQASIAPFWDDLRTDQSAGDLVLARFEDKTGDSVPDRLVIEWSDVGHGPTSPGTATFQAILQLNTGTADGNIIFNYVDLDFGDASMNSGRSASVGIKATGAQGVDRLLVAKDSAVHPLIGSGKAILLDRTRPGGDVIDVTPDPRSTSVSSIDVTFTEAIDPSIFDYRDLTLTRSGGANLITSGVSVALVSGTTWRISGLSGLTGSTGTYVLSVAMSGIVDTLGHRGAGSISDTWVSGNMSPDIRVISATANGATTLTVTYDISGGTVPQFDLTVYRSDDTAFGGDLSLGTVTISAPGDLTVGPHTLSWTIGNGTGAIPLPGAGATEVDTSYYLLVVADAADVVVESDSTSPGTNNVGVFSGVYHAPSGPVLVQGGSGNDTVSVSGSISVTVNSTTFTYVASDVATLRVRGHDGDDTVTASALGKPLWAWGGAGNDTLTGGSAADTLVGGAGNDSLAGGSGDDTYQFKADTALGSDTVSEAVGAGTDGLDFSPGTMAIVLDLSLTTAQAANAYLTLTLSAGDVIENLTGTSDNDMLTGNTLANVLFGLDGIDTLRGMAGHDTLWGGNGNDMLYGAGGNDSQAGGDGNDTYYFNASVNIGADVITELSGEGTDTIDFSQFTTTGVTLDLSKTTAQTVSPANLTLTLSAGNVFENITAGAGPDLLIGNGLANVLSGLAGNDTLEGGGGNDTLTGGNDNDTYRFNTNSTMGSDTVVEASGGGTDLLDFSSSTTLGAIVDLSSTASQTVNANLSLTLSGGSFVENMTGGAGDDTITGLSPGNVINGGAGIDLLRLSGNGTSLDLLATGGTSLMNVESIDLRSGGANTLAVSAASILSLVQPPPATSQTLTVYRDSNDTVTVNADLNYIGVQSIGGTAFSVYTQGGARLNVEIPGLQPVTVTVNLSSGVYTDSQYAATGTVSTVGGTPGTTLDGVGLTFTYYAGATVSGTPLSGAPVHVGTYTVVANYAGSATFSSGSAQTTFTISPAALTITAASNSKTYDGTTSAAATPTVSGLRGNDTVTNLTEVYTQKTAGSNKTLTVATYTVNDGNNGANYTISTVDNTSGVISARTLTVSAAGVNRVYDGTTSATVTLSDNRVAGDALTTSYGSASFVNKNVGTGKAVSVSGIAISGADSANYALSSTTASTTANIAIRTLTVGATGVNRVYDGTTSATVTLSDDRVSGDTLSTSYASAAFLDKHAGSDKAVSVSGIAISGADSANYALSSTTASTTANISVRGLTITAQTNTKAFDGTTSAAAVPVVAGLQSGDTVTGLSEVYDSSAVGTGKTLSVATYTINDGNSGQNYSVATVADTTGEIQLATDIQMTSLVT
ncbi:MAG: YDG domain-containing protein, partial [Planctomycetales bacterium]